MINGFKPFPISRHLGHYFYYFQESQLLGSTFVESTFKALENGKNLTCW